MLSGDSDIKSNQPQQKPSRQQDHCHEEGGTEDEAADCHTDSEGEMLVPHVQKWQPDHLD
jgi:hypothetical protein